MAKVKVVYNAYFGRFGLSSEAEALLGNKPYGYWNKRRHDKRLVEIVEKLGEKANGRSASLKIATVSGPYRIVEDDGYESVETSDSYEWVNPNE